MCFGGRGGRGIRPLGKKKFGVINILMLLHVAVQNSNALFQELDERINYVATKVVHLGDQLEGINNPRSRAMETRELMKYFEEFLSEDGEVSSVFTDPDKVSMLLLYWEMDRWNTNGLRVTNSQTTNNAGTNTTFSRWSRDRSP